MVIKTRKTSNELIIEKLVDRKFETPDRCYYLVKWVDKPDSENTWEPEENLSCPELIRSLEKEITERAQKSTPPPTPKKIKKAIEVQAAISAHGNNHFLIKMEDGSLELICALEAIKLYTRLIGNYLVKELKAEQLKTEQRKN